MTRKAVLIIKHGFSETCDHNVSPVVSLGDVFRCTCLLEDFRGCRVTWITSPPSHDLLRGNHLIDRLILADSSGQLPPEVAGDFYHVIINLEKQRDWCEFSLSVSGERRYGFKNWACDGRESFYPDSAAALSTALQRDDFRPIQETLFKTIGGEWIGQHYILGYQPNITPIYDVGLNHHIGPKWPNKVWPKQHWQELYERLSETYAVCWQQSLNSVRHYIEWLATCRLIVTCDSLGLHLGIGLKRKMVGLFGPTPPEQIYMYGCGIKLTPICDRNCIPCFEPRCIQESCCMEHITVDMVLEAIRTLISVPEQVTPSVMAEHIPPEPAVIMAT